MATETIKMRQSVDFEPQRFRERQPTEVCEAILYEDAFPLQFLEDGENVRSAGDGEGTCIISVDDKKGEAWDMIQLRVGYWLVRFPTLGLRSYHPASFEENYEEVHR